jgi:hypothetical protein
MALHLSPPSESPKPAARRTPQRPAAHDQCHLKRSPLRLEGAPPRYYLSGASRDLTTDFDNVHIPFHWDRAVSKENEPLLGAGCFAVRPKIPPNPNAKRRKPSLPLRWYRSSACISPPLRKHSARGKEIPHERPAELPSVASSDRFRPPLAI